MTRNLRVIPGGRAAGVSTSAAALGVRSDAAVGTVGATTLAADGGLRDLYGRYGGSVYIRCCYLLKDRAKAEDAMQDVFAKALVNMAGFRAEASPLTWLIKIATNHCLNLLRSDRAAWHKTFEDQEQARVAFAEHDGPASGPRLFEDREAVRKLLENLDLETQAAAIHYYVDEMTLEEVAAALGRSVPTVRKRLETFAAQSGLERV
jgi:RNA polymerase sigma-70 factor, ECF subfamily